MEAAGQKPLLNLGNTFNKKKLDVNRSAHNPTWIQDTSISESYTGDRSQHFDSTLDLKQRHTFHNLDSLTHVPRVHEKRLAPLFPSSMKSQSQLPLSVQPLIKQYINPSNAPAPPSVKKTPVSPQQTPTNNPPFEDGRPLDSNYTPMVTAKALIVKKTQTQHKGVATVDDQGDKRDSATQADDRKGKRETRARPWAVNQKSSPARKVSAVKKNQNIVKEVHYQKILPPEKWAKSDSKKYAKNHKWGPSYTIQKENGKVAEPGTPLWWTDDGFRMWLLEKAADLDMEQNITKVMNQNRLRRVKGLNRDEREVLATQKWLYDSYKEQQEQMEREHASAIRFQRVIRGWRVRRMIFELKQKVLLVEGKTLKAFMSEYRGVVSRVMQRQGKPLQVPFNMDAMHDYLDRKAEWKETFKTFTAEEGTPGFLPVPALPKVFNTVENVVTDDQIELYFDSVFAECKSRADFILMVDLPVSLGEDTFVIQSEFQKQLVKSLHIGTKQIRMGYLPYNTEVFVNFNLGEYNTREDILQRLEKVRYHEGINRTDLALKEMRNMFRQKRNRSDMSQKRIAIIISEGASYASHLTRKQAQEAIKKDNIDIYGIALGKNPNTSELLAITGDEDKVMAIPHVHAIGKIKNMFLHKTEIKDCQYCELKGAKTGISSGRGLAFLETMEIVWMVCPPGHKKKKFRKRNKIHNGFFNDDIDLDPEEDGNDALYDPCLGFLVKSRLDREGVIDMPTGGDASAPVSTWQEALVRAKGYSQAEAERRAREEEEAKQAGYRDNIITDEESTEDAVQDSEVEESGKS